jgi:circadian clock protein KaiC
MRLALMDVDNVRARMGVPGLDDILSGGLLPGHVYLLEGNPGTGKTTTALRFLLEGAEKGEKGLYITLSETESELRAGAKVARMGHRRQDCCVRTRAARKPA